MTLLPVPDLLAAARPGGLAAFNVIALEHAEAIAAAAEAANRPAILQISQNTVRYHGGLKPLVRACLAIAEDSSAPLAVHLDHATERRLITAAVELGITSVMYDGSTLDYAENVDSTADIARWCHERDVFVEAELGEVGGKDGAHAPGVRTDPDEAVAFVAATGVDALAVAVGSSHAMHTRDARLDDELIARLAAKVPVPLVLHGSSGVPDAGLRSAIDHGMTKINIATRLNVVLAESVRGILGADDRLSDPRKYLGPGRAAVQAEVERFLRLLA
ncbi:class II fructose-bisphosphate aldolase [Nocardia sp. CDC159]|uniref:Class II fructose-bisphosphate aldolase n=1 Tax=Nocardia pulmonis TaxID=2951408 RepID=A0A9X2E7T7_9NOCA|nr:MULTISPECIES: class II fructose-bisphosphate aldolase [Nocardia]MCM6774783.1 class II fructose-bisphosphate aldolase [Nocardia pulmonis]MCM6789714.1 class II fructose-bisphosphate aldolase [Nocardia sp. CDC159]